MAKVIVIGAGISGLTAAYALWKGGHDVTVLDQCGRPGGRMHSEQVAGFLMEHGPNTMVSLHPATEALIAELGLSDERVFRGDAARNRYLVRDGQAHALPLQPHRFFLSNFFSLPGRLRMLMEVFIPAECGDETVAGFARRRFGTEFLDYVMNPLVGGLYAGNPEQLSVSAVFPQLKRLEQSAGSIIGAAMKSRWLNNGTAGTLCPGSRRLFSFREGLDTLPRALAQRLAGRVFLRFRVEEVHARSGGRFQVKLRHGDDTRLMAADSVVVALPAYAAARILRHVGPEAAETLSEIPHPPLSVVFLGYGPGSISHCLDGIGMLVPAVEKRNTLGILFSSTLFAGRAPPGHIALTAFVGGARQPDLAMLAPDELENLVHSEVRDLLGARAMPCLSRVRYWRSGLPQPDSTHADRIRKIRAFETEHAGVFLTGNYFSGISTSACMEAALATALRVERHLSEFEATLARERG